MSVLILASSIDSSHSFFFLLNIFLTMSTACGSAQARDSTHTTAVTQATAVTVPDPLPSHQGTPIYQVLFFHSLRVMFQS